MGKAETNKLGQILRVLSRRGDVESKLDAIRTILDAKPPKAKKSKKDEVQPELSEAGTE